MIHPDDIKLKFLASMNLSTHHHSVSRDNDLGVQMETISNKSKCGTGITKTNKWFFIDHDDREFLTVEELVDAYNEKFKFEGENPEYEVKYVRVVSKRDKPQ